MNRYSNGRLPVAPNLPSQQNLSDNGTDEKIERGTVDVCGKPEFTLSVENVDLERHCCIEPYEVTSESATGRSAALAALFTLVKRS